MHDIRHTFEQHRDQLSMLYAALDWEQKAVLLKALIEANDHPPGFVVSYDIGRVTPAEREYLRAIGIGPFPDTEGPDAA